jgi:predicted Rdx family selenoprotein
MTNDRIDWFLTPWEGSRCEQYCRRAQFTLREILLAQEEMQKLAECLGNTGARKTEK